MFWISAHNQPHQREINKFYKQHKQNVSANVNDRVFVARTESSDNLIASLILRDYSTSLSTSMATSLPNAFPETQAQKTAAGVWLLRSLYVTPRMRRLGVGTELIKEASKAIDSHIYTICEAELIPLYQGVGFTVTTDIPEQLTNTLNKKSLTLMVKLPSSVIKNEVF